MQNECIVRLTDAGIMLQDAMQLRRIAMTLHRWHELECGNGNDYASWTIARGNKTASGFVHDDNGKPYLERHVHSESKPHYEPIADRESGAQRRLAAIMKRYPGFVAYVQGDPRGASLYILRPNDMPEGSTIDNCYSRGIAVYK